MTASEARQVTNKVREDNANSAMEEIIEKSEEKNSRCGRSWLIFCSCRNKNFYG